MELREELGEFLPTSVPVPGMLQLQGFPLGKSVGWEWMGVFGARLSHTQVLPKLLGQTGVIHPAQRLQPLCLPPEKPSSFLSIHLLMPALVSLFEGLAIRMLIMTAVKKSSSWYL